MKREDRYCSRCVAGNIAGADRRNCSTGTTVLAHSLVAPTEDTPARTPVPGPADNQTRGLEEELAAGKKAC